MDTKLILTVTTLHFLALISPGPDFVLTIRNSLKFGRNMGISTAFGFGAGIALHVAYSILGVAILIKNFPSAFQIVKIIGALYLIWLGLTTLWALWKRELIHDINTTSSIKKENLLIGFRQGFFTNVLNPKATLFILGLFTSIIPVETNLPTLIACGVIMVSVTVLWFILVSSLFGTEKIRLNYLNAQRGLNLLFATFFLAAGSFILFS